MLMNCTLTPVNFMLCASYHNLKKFFLRGRGSSRGNTNVQYTKDAYLTRNETYKLKWLSTSKTGKCLQTYNIQFC